MSDAKIRATKGPYEVTGGVPLYRRERIKSERGESLGWRTTEKLETEDTYWLCRCGQSNNKPFCDSSHQRCGFVGEDAAPTEYAEAAKDLAAAEPLSISDNRSLCVHASFCVTQFTNVWKQASETDDPETRARLMGAIENCPSGALTYAVEGTPIEPLLPQAIAVTDDGPLWVTGGVPVVDSNNQTLEARNRVTLCRCGASETKPLCDGSHSKIAFKDS